MEKRETEKIEFKKSTAQLKEAVISLCAMLNKHNKGKVYFGIKDDGTVCGQDIGKRTTADISHEIRYNLKPLPEVDIEINEADGKQIIAITVKGNDTPYSAYGRYYTRVDDSDILMDTKMLWKYFESKKRTYSKWEEETTSYGIEKINEELLIQYIREANDAGRMNYVYRNAEEALEKLGLINKEGLLNNAGYFLFGNDGPLTIKEVVYPTDERENFTDLRQYQGNIFECINEASKYILNNIHYSAEIVGLKREETPEIPIKAIREIVINSFAHCRYQKGEYNEISITKSKVKIYNPGGIIEDKDPTEFASGKIGSRIRNPLIATVLYKNKYIDAFGTGFSRAFKACEENGNKYEYRNDEFGFTFEFERKADREIRHSNLNYEIKERPNELNDLIVRALSEDGFLTIPKLAEKVDKSEATVHRHLNDLVERNKIARIGSRKTGYWMVKEKE